MTIASTSNVRSKYDVVVLGLGGVGSLALRALGHDVAASGGHFLGIERYSASRMKDRATSSSCGRTRIYRRAYFEHEHYVPWIDYSLQIFRVMEQQSNEQLMQQCGTLIMESSAHLSNPHELPTYVAASKLSADLHNIPVEYYNANELPHRFPQFRYNKIHKTVGIYEPGGGFVRPERVIETAIQQSRQPSNGSTIDILENSTVTKIYNMSKSCHENEPIELQIIPNNDYETTKQQQYTIQTDYLLIAAGSWTGQLIPEWAPYLNVVRQIQTWINTAKADNNGSQYSYHHMPGFVYSSPDFPKDAFYGLPCDTDHPNPDVKTWLKLGLHKQDGYNRLLNQNPSINQKVATEEEIIEMKQAIAKGIDSKAWNNNQDNKEKEYPEFVHTQPCMYTMSPDKHYIIGTPASTRNKVFAVAGLSGHGFKCTPALSQIMVDYVFRGKDDMTHWRTEFCSPKRFGI